MNNRPAPSRPTVAPLAAAFAAALGATAPAHAADATGAPAAERVAPIIVTGPRVERSTFDVPMSVDALDTSLIQDAQLRVNLSEALARVPGVVVGNRGNYAQDLQVSTRGFGSRSTFGIRGIKLIVDDVPASMPDGQGQAATVNLGATRRIEVLRGPFSAIYGNASGGVIQAFTEDGPPDPTLSASLAAGSYSTSRGELKLGGQWGPLNYLLDGSRFHTLGYRDHSAATRDQANAKLRYPLGDAGTLTIVANTLRQPDTQDPLGLTAAQVAADPRQADSTATAFNTRKHIENNQGGAVYQMKLGAGDTLRLVGYTGTRQIVQFLAVPRGAQIPASSSGGVVDLDREFAGAGVRWTHLFGTVTPLTLTVGLDYDRSEERRKGYENFVGATLGVRGRLRREENNVVSSTDPYAQLEWQVAGPLSLLAGVRHSEVKFTSKDYFIRTGNPDDSGEVTFRDTNPVAGLLFKATPGVNLYLSYGQGFETPTFAELAYKPDGTTGLNFALRPSTSRNLEAGVKARVGDAARVNLALFDTRTEDEIVPATNSGGRATFQNTSRTTRRGAEISADWDLADRLNLYAAWTWLDASFDESFTYRPTAAPATVTVAAGNRLPGVARTTGYAELAWNRAGRGFSAGLEITYRDRVFVNDVNSESAASYTVANLRLGFAHQAGGWKLKEFVRVDNIADRNYVGSAIVNEANGRFYEPSPGRSYLAGIDASHVF